MLRVQEMGESDRLATLLTPDHGKLRAIARGAQKGRSHLSAAVQPFVQARLLLWQGRQMDGISQAEIVHAPVGLAQDLSRFAAASYCCELADAFATERQEQPAMFLALASVLRLLHAAEHCAVAVRWFELSLLAAAGFQPELQTCPGCGVDLQGPRAARFSAAAGGALCGKCAGAAEDGAWLSGTAMRALRYLAGASASAVPAVRIGPATMAQMENALEQHIAGIVQRPVRSRALMDTLAH